MGKESRRVLQELKLANFALLKIELMNQAGLLGFMQELIKHPILNN